MVRGRSEPQARWGAARARSTDAGREGGASGRGPAQRPELRDHGNPGELYTRRGEGCARGARGEGRRLGIEEDDRRDRRREPRLEAREGAEGRCADPRRAGAKKATGYMI